MGAGRAWELPGYEVHELLGAGAGGEVWRAREVATGELVALKRARPGAGRQAVEALRREAGVLRGLSTPYVVGLRDIVGDVLVLDLAAGGSIAGLLARRGRLEPGEVVTVVAPVAEAVASLHASGWVHGDLSPANVLLTGDGMPLLTDLGGACRAGEHPDRLVGTAEYVDPGLVAGRAPDSASDVWALGALCSHLLAGSPPHEGDGVEDVLDGGRSGSRAPLGLLAPAAPRALVEVVESALRRDPATRPTAAELALALHRAQRPAPLGLDGAASAVAAPPELRDTHVVPRPDRLPPAPPRRARLAPAVLAVAATVLALLAGGLAWALGGPRAGGAQALPPAAPAGAASAGPSRWLAVLDGLDAARSRALAGAEPALLDRVWAPGSGASDRDVVLALAKAGQRAVGVRHRVRSVQEREVGAGRVVLRVVDALSAHELRDGRGSLLERRPARGPAVFRVTLVSAGDGWLLSEVRPER